MRKLLLLAITCVFYGLVQAQSDYPISTDFESLTVGNPCTRTEWEGEGFEYAWGSDASFPVRSEIVTETSVSGSKSLKITYPEGEVGPSGGGAQALFSIPKRDEIFSSYYVRFSEDFSWGGTNKEGKLPGICGMGGWNVCDGGKTCDGTNGFSARPIWYGDGNLMLYLYDMDKTGVYGVNYPLTDAEGNQIVIKKGEWIHIAERVKINTVTDGVANPDGEVEFWINGVQALSISGYRFITTDDKINVFYFDTFMGGSGSAYAPANTCYTWFDDMIISDTYDDVKYKEQTSTIVLPAADVTVSIDAQKGNKAISPYLYAMNRMLNDTAAIARAKEAGLRLSRENSGNNSTCYNWRLKLTTHPDWYNNVEAEDWDTKAQTLASDFSGMQGMFSFQMLGYAATTRNYNFPDWEYNGSKWWSGCSENYCGNGSTKGDYKFTEGDVTLYSKEWPADSTVAILNHWTSDLHLDMNQFIYWDMDNEPEIWGGTHDAFISYSQEMFERLMTNYFAIVKKVRAINPNIKICGPVAANEWSWYVPGNMQPTYNGKTYSWLEYFIMRCAMEEKATGVKMIDVFDLHFYPEDTELADILQSHRALWNTEFDYPKANGVKKIAGKWDNSITKEMIFVRCQEWIDQYFGEGYDISYGVSEWGTKEVSSQSSMIYALSYASMIGEGARNGMEFFIPWYWRNGMWETVHLFGRYAKNINVEAESSNESMISAYTSVNSSQDSMTVIVVNRDPSNSLTVNSTISNFDIADGSYDVYVLSNLPDGEETFKSHTDNALVKQYALVSNGVMSVTVPSYSISAVILVANETKTYTVKFVADEKIVSEQNIQEGHDANAPKNPTKIGYDFVKWDTDFTNVSKDLTITAVFEKHQYTVTFEDWDGETIDEQKVAFGDDAVVPQEPTRENYTFTGWSGPYTNISADVTIIATYTENGKASYVALDEAIASVGSLQESEYTLDSWSTLQTALMNANNVSRNLYSEDQSVVDAATKALQEAIDGLVIKEVEKIKASYVALDEVIATAGSLQESEYTSDSWSILQTALTNANNVSRDLYSEDQSIVDAATKALQEAIDGLVIKEVEKIKASYVALDEAIASVSSLQELEYTSDSWSTLQTALTNANNVSRELYSEDQSIVDAATKALQESIAGLVIKEVEKTKASYVALDEVIATVGSLQESEYTSDSWSILQTALTNVNNVSRNLYSEDQSIVDAATKALQEAIDGLVTLNKTMLVAAIDSANSIISSVSENIGDEVGQYPQSAVDALQSAISTSQQTYNDAQTQGELDTQTMVLNNAIQTFLNSMNQRIIDVSTLSALVEKANELLLNNTGGENPGQYRLLEYMALSTARNGGEAILQQTNPSDESIYTQVDRLESAIEAFLNAYIPLSISDVDVTKVIVYAVNNVIYVKNAENKDITIYDNSGQIVLQTSTQQASAEYYMRINGVYFVRVGNESYVVLVGSK